jgi:hypothetical protein
MTESDRLLKENWKRIEFIGYSFRLKNKLLPEPGDGLLNCMKVCKWVDQELLINPEKDFGDFEDGIKRQRKIVAQYNAKVKVAENGPVVMYLLHRRNLPMEMVGEIVKFL